VSAFESRVVGHWACGWWACRTIEMIVPSIGSGTGFDKTVMRFDKLSNRLSNYTDRNGLNLTIFC